MGYFDNAENASAYLEMCAELGPSFLTKILPKYVPFSSSVLEIGMGPGHDLGALSDQYNVTGSDTSNWFLDHYRLTHPNANLLKIDALTLETYSNFDAIYSNKVLHQFNFDDILFSYKHQAARLNPRGVTLHSFWKGTSSENFGGDTCYYFEPDQITQAISTAFEVLECQVYDEMSPNDSFWVAAQKNKRFYFSVSI